MGLDAGDAGGHLVDQTLHPQPGRGGDRRPAAATARRRAFASSRRPCDRHLVAQADQLGSLAR